MLHQHGRLIEIQRALRFGDFSSPDVLYLCNEESRITVVVAAERGAEHYAEDGAVFCADSASPCVSWQFDGGELTRARHRYPWHINALAIADGQFGFAVADDVAQRGIDLEPAAVESDQRHTDGSMGESSFIQPVWKMRNSSCTTATRNKKTGREGRFFIANEKEA